MFKNLYNTLLRTYTRRDLSQWEHPADTAVPIYGVYHVFCANGWQDLVAQQIQHLKDSGLLAATEKFYVSCIYSQPGDVEKLKEIVADDKMEIISATDDATCFEYPALDFIREKSNHDDCFFYYFHTKGVSFFSNKGNDRHFLSFKRRVNAWREMMEYFLMDKWNVAVNVLSDGYDTYGCYRYPPAPAPYLMYAGNFWWIRSDYARNLPPFDSQKEHEDRTMAENWVYKCHPRDFSAFDTVALLYRIEMPPTLYRNVSPNIGQRLHFIFRYNYVKMLKKVFKYNFDKRLNWKYQKI